MGWVVGILAILLANTNLRYHTVVPGLAVNESVAVEAQDPASYEDQMLIVVNEFRAENGLAALKRNPALDRVAQRRAELALDYYLSTGQLAHDNPNISGDRYFEILPTEGIASWLWAGENLAANNYPDSVAKSMIELKNSPMHRANLLDSDWTDIGIGYAHRDGFHCFAQIFLAPR